MSTRRLAGLTFEQTASKPLDVSKLAAASLVSQAANDPTRGKTLLGPFTLAASETQYIDHGLGRPAQGFVHVIPAGYGEGGGNLISVQLDDTEAKTHLAILNSSGSPITFLALVF